MVVCSANAPKTYLRESLLFAASAGTLNSGFTENKILQLEFYLTLQKGDAVSSVIVPHGRVCLQLQSHFCFAERERIFVFLLRVEGQHPSGGGTTILRRCWWWAVQGFAAPSASHCQTSISPLKGKNGSFLLPPRSGFNVTVSNILIHDTLAFLLSLTFGSLWAPQSPRRLFEALKSSRLGRFRKRGKEKNFICCWQNLANLPSTKLKPTLPTVKLCFLPRP